MSGRDRWIALGVSLTILTASAAGLNAAVSRLKLYLRKLPVEGLQQVRAVPAELPGWVRVGQDERTTEEVLAELGTKNCLTRVYMERNPPEGRRPAVLQLHMAYYTGMVDTVPHVPERCMVGGGWSIGSITRAVPVPLDASRWFPYREAPAGWGEMHRARLDAGREREMETLPAGGWVTLPRGVEDLRLRVTDFEQPGTDKRLFAGYFFIANGAVCDSAEDVRLLAFDIRADYAFYLKVQISSESAASAEELAEASGRLLDELLPEIMLCVPDWVEVTSGRYPPDNPRAASGGAGGGV